MSSLNPVHTVGSQIAEAMEIHGRASGAGARRETIDLLGRVGIPGAAGRLDDYPHQFSDGMRSGLDLAWLRCPAIRHHAVGSSGPRHAAGRDTMAHEPHPTIIDQYWRAVRDRDPSRIAALVTDDFVEDWSQSGERIRGADAWGRVVRGHPAYPAVSVRRIVGGADIWVCEADFDYGGETGVWRICSVLELSGDRIARITQYFGAPFPAADWRREITEPIVS